MSAPVTVLHVHDRSTWGGNIEHIRLLARGGDPSRYRAIVAGPPDEGWTVRLAAEGIPVVPSSIASKWDLGAAARLATTARECGARLVHTHIRRADLMGALAAALEPGLTAVATLHGPVGVDEQGRDTGGAGVYGRVLRHGFAAVITVSDALRREAIERLGCDPARVVHVVNGVDLTRFATPDVAAARVALGLADGEAAIGMVARFVAHDSLMKGHADLLRAFAALAPSHPAARCAFVGDGPSRPAMAALAAGLGVAARVRFLGQRDDVPRLLPGFAVVALPSRGEGLPRALVEAMACGVPVVGSAVGGIPELLAEGAGLVVPPGDPAALAAALGRVLDEPALAAALATAGRIRAARHDAAAMCRGTQAVYDRVLGLPAEH